jgi:hypothetical protein
VDVAGIVHLDSNEEPTAVSPNALLKAISSKLKYRHLKTKHETAEELTTRDRDELVRLIIDEVLEKHGQKRVSARVLSAWAKQVKQLFPGERSEFFYHPGTNFESGKRITKPTGKFIFRLGYARKVLRSGEGNPLKRPHSSVSSSSPSITHIREIPKSLQQIEAEEIDNCDIGIVIEWLGETVSPEELVRQRWAQTIQFRAEELQRIDIEEYIHKYKALRTPLGLDLVSYFY